MNERPSPFQEPLRRASQALSQAQSSMTTAQAETARWQDDEQALQQTVLPRLQRWLAEIRALRQPPDRSELNARSRDLDEYRLIAWRHPLVLHTRRDITRLRVKIVIARIWRRRRQIAAALLIALTIAITVWLGVLLIRSYTEFGNIIRQLLQPAP